MALLIPAVRQAAAAETEVSAGVEVVNIAESGAYQGKVREYDGREPEDGVEFDLGLKGVYGNTLLDLAIKDLSSGNDSGYVDLNLGSLARVQGSVDVLTHRQTFPLNGAVIDGTWVDIIEFNNRGYSSFIFVPNFAGWAQDLKFTRTVSQAKIDLKVPQTPLSFSFQVWNEGEKGATPGWWRNSNVYTGRQEINRYTRDLIAEMKADLGEGHAVYQFLARKFGERAASIVDERDTGVDGIMQQSIINWTSDQTVAKHTVAGNYRMGNLRVAGGLTSRKRNHHFTDYTTEAYAANVAAAFKPTKDFGMTARFYGHITKTVENESNRQYQITGNNGGVENMDFYEYKADFRFLYTGIDKVKLKASYTPAYTYRKYVDLHTEVTTFNNKATFPDGWYFYPDRSKVNGPAAKNLVHNVKLGADVALPNDMGLGLDLRALKASVGAYQSMPTDEAGARLNFTAPLGPVMLGLGAGHTDSKNRNASFIRYKRMVNSGDATLGFSKGKFSGGLSYIFELIKHQHDVFFGDQDDPTRNGPIHVYMPTKINNHMVSINGEYAVKSNFKLDAEGSLMSSKSSNNPGDSFDTAPGGTQYPVSVSDINPTNVRVYHWGVGADYDVNKDLLARLEYDESLWIDRFGGSNSGRASIVSLSLTGKFGPGGSK